MQKTVILFLKKLSCFSLIVIVCFLFGPTCTAQASPYSQMEEEFDEMEKGGIAEEGTFSKITKVLYPKIKSLYKGIEYLGFICIGVAALVAVVSFGLCKDVQAVKEKKEWFIRIAVGIFLAGSLLTLFGMVEGVRL